MLVDRRRISDLTVLNLNSCVAIRNDLSIYREGGSGTCLQFSTLQGCSKSYFIFLFLETSEKSRGQSKDRPRFGGARVVLTMRELFRVVNNHASRQNLFRRCLVIIHGVVSNHANTFFAWLLITSKSRSHCECQN